MWRRAGAAALWCALVAAAAMHAPRLQFDNDTWLRAEDPRKIELDEFRAEFEPDEALLLVVELDADFFRESHMAKIRALEADLEALAETRAVLSPLSATTIIDTGETLEIGSFDEALQKGFFPDISAFKDAFLESPYAGRLLSSARRHVLLRVAIAREDAPARTAAVTAVMQTTRAHGVTAYFAGEAALKHELNRATREQLPKLLGLAALMLVVFLRLACGNWARAAVIFAAASGAVAACLGWMGAFSWPMNAVLLILPVMVAVIAVADGLHILANWDALAGETHAARLRACIGHTWAPCLGATATSAAGFGAFAVSELVPLQHFGYASALSIFYAYPLIVGAVWGALWGWPRAGATPHARLHWAKFTAFLQTAASTRARHIALGMLCAAALLGAGLSFVRTETNFLAVFFSESSEIQRAFAVVDAELGGSGRIEIIRRAPPESFAQHEPMRKLAAFSAELAEIGTVNHVDSYLLPVGMADRAFGGDGMPDDDAQLSQELLFLSLSRSQSERGVLAPYLDFSQGNARLSLQTANLHSPELARTLAEVESRAATAGLDLAHTQTTTGFGVFIHHLSEHVLHTQARSILLTLLIIAAFFLVQFGMRLGCAALLANILPLAATAGLVAWLRFPYDFAAILIAGVTIALAVDDTIHFLHHYRRAAAQSARAAREIAFSRCARPIAVTTALFCCGLGVVAFSELVVLRRFAGFAMFGISCALAATLFFLPAILAILAPRSSRITHRTR